MAYFKHVLFEEHMLALDGNLAKVHPFAIDKVLHCSCLIANTKGLVFFASQRDGCTLDLLVTNLVLIKWHIILSGL